MSNSWYKPKTHGYGAAPANWKGWAFIALFALYVFAVSAIFVVIPLMQMLELPLIRYIFWAFLVVLGGLIFVKITAAKTDGAWRWRWGGE